MKSCQPFTLTNQSSNIRPHAYNNKCNYTKGKASYMFGSWEEFIMFKILIPIYNVLIILEGGLALHLKKFECILPKDYQKKNPCLHVIDVS